MGWLTRWFLKSSRFTTRPGRPAIRLLFEELESRWVPSTVSPSSSTNWGGYAVTTTPGAVSAVSGSWTVPTVTGSGSGITYSSAWVGIDGFNSSSVEQTGTEMDVSKGVAHYSAWWEMYPNAPVTISSITVHPGDTISASVTYNTTAHTFTLKITDGKQSFTTTQNAPAGAQEDSAEWIVEAPSSGSGVLPLANFNAVTFTNAQATINGTAAAIDADPTAWQAVDVAAYQINISAGRSGPTEAATSALADSGTPLSSAFTVAYGSSTPPVPGQSTPTPPAPTPPAPTPPTPVATTVATTTTLTAKVNPSFWFQPPSVTLTVTVTPPSGSTAPTGEVELMYDGQVLTITNLQNNHGVETATITVSFLQPGKYTLSATYVGTSQFQGSASNSLTFLVT